MPDGSIEECWKVAAGVRFRSLRVAGAGDGDGGPPLLLVPGIGLAADNLVRLLQALAAVGRRQAHALDLPGFGGTRAAGPPLDLVGLGAAVRVWADAMGWRRPALVGVSFGCQVVMEAASRTPSLPSAAVLVAPTLPPRLRGFVKLFRQRFGAGADEPRGLTVNAIGDYVRAGLGRVLHTYREAIADRPEDRAASIECRALVIRGERDTLVDEEWATLLAERMPRARVATIPGAAHSAQLTAADRVAAVIDGFLAGGGTP